MKALEEIFIAETPDKLIWSDDPEKLKPYINVYRYLRKDVVDETIQTAEDHAYFAGKEKMREELLEWAKENEKRLGGLLTPTNQSLVVGGKLYAYQEFIDKIESL